MSLPVLAYGVFLLFKLALLNIWAFNNFKPHTNIKYIPKVINLLEYYIDPGKSFQSAVGEPVQLLGITADLPGMVLLCHHIKCGGPWLRRDGFREDAYL